MKNKKGMIAWLVFFILIVVIMILNFIEQYKRTDSCDKIDYGYYYMQIDQSNVENGYIRCVKVITFENHTTEKVYKIVKVE
jgi:hypothetical protein